MYLSEVSADDSGAVTEEAVTMELNVDDFIEKLESGKHRYVLQFLDVIKKCRIG